MTGAAYMQGIKEVNQTFQLKQKDKIKEGN